MILPLKVPTYVSALAEAQEASVNHKKETVYLYRVSEGYLIDTKEHSDNKLMKKCIVSLRP